MKWAYRAIEGINAPSNKSAALGTQIHSELEAWLTSAKPPQHPAAIRSLPLLPVPTHPGLLVEHPFRLLFPVGAARGYIDLLIPRPVVESMPAYPVTGGAWSETIPVVIDHKSTGHIEKATENKDLRTDPQALLYGAEARRLTDSRGDVDLVWNYLATTSPKTKVLHLRQTLPMLEDGLGVLLEDAKTMAAEKATALKAKDLKYDLRTCDKYGGCPYRAQCPAYMRSLFANLESGALSSALSGNLLASMASIPYASVTYPVPMKGTMTTATAPSTSLLARLRAAKATPPKTVEVPAASGPPAATVGTQVVTPEPGLPSPDISGLSTPLPPGSSPINPPDAAPNVSPEDPPLPEEVAATASVAKPKRGRPRTQKSTGVTETILYDGPTDVSVVVDDTIDPAAVQALLKSYMNLCVQENRFILAQQLLLTLTCMQQGG
jgi:hypothetical protein